MVKHLGVVVGYFPLQLAAIVVPHRCRQQRPARRQPSSSPRAHLLAVVHLVLLNAHVRSLVLLRLEVSAAGGGTARSLPARFQAQAALFQAPQTRRCTTAPSTRPLAPSSGPRRGDHRRQAPPRKPALMAHLAKYLLPPRLGLVALVGLGPCGPTALAGHAAGN